MYNFKKKYENKFFCIYILQMKYIGIDVIIEFCLKYGYIIVLKERVFILNF